MKRFSPPAQEVRNLPRNGASAVVEDRAGALPVVCGAGISRVSHQVSYLVVSQVKDEARRTDVFRKRALAKGGGITKASPASESAPRTIIEAPNYVVASALKYIPVQASS